MLWTCINENPKDMDISHKYKWKSIWDIEKILIEQTGTNWEPYIFLRADNIGSEANDKFWKNSMVLDKIYNKGNEKISNHTFAQLF